MDGPGEWIGDASIGANPVNAAGGIATGLLRAGSSEGRILVRAAAFGLSPGTMEIVSQRCRKIEGLIRNSSGPACVNVVD